MDRETLGLKLEHYLLRLGDMVHPDAADLAAALLPHVPERSRDRELTPYLLSMIEKLRPSSGDDDLWRSRRFELLNLRYTQDQSPDLVAARLAISPRHVYRQLKRALADFTDFVWDQTARPPHAVAPPEHPGHTELLYRESSPILRSEHSSSLIEVLNSVQTLLEPLRHSGSPVMDIDFPQTLPDVAISAEILRQFLIGLLGDLLHNSGVTAVHLSTQVRKQCVDLRIRISKSEQPDSPGSTQDGEWSKVSERASAKLAMLHGALLSTEQLTEQASVFQVRLPTTGADAVLIVDDNEEVCLLFRRYLASAGYQPIVAKSGSEALQIARSRKLFAATLDLMMEGEDGWDVLQALRHDERTISLPIIVCTVLDHHDLAIMLGATAFIKKPVRRDQLLTALDAINSAAAHHVPPATSPADHELDR